MMLRSARALTLATALALSGCAVLEPIPEGACGNGVVDPGEDCDGFPRGEGTLCRASGATLACRLDCTPDGTTGVAAACPTGWGCSAVDHVCRAPAGRFATGDAPVPAVASQLFAGDLDGDGATDLVLREPPGAGNVSKVRAYWFDADARVARSLLVPAHVGAPLLGRLDAADSSDLAFTLGGGVGVMRGLPDRTLLAVAYPTYTVPAAGDLRVLVVRSTLGVPAMLLAYLRIGETAFGTLSDLAATGELGASIKVARQPDALAGDALVANVLDEASSPCDEVVLAYKDATDVTVISPCKAGGQGGLNPNAPTLTVSLPSGLKIDRGVIAADANGDGHLDLLIGAGGKTYVALANAAGTGFAAPTGPARVTVVEPTGVSAPYELPLPLAGGELSRDGVVDYVLPDRVLTSSALLGPATYGIAYKRGTGAWTSAVIADFNGNGLPDVVAGSRTDVDLDFLNGTGSGSMNPFTLTTLGPTATFTVGDVDGDLLPDLVLTQRTSTTPPVDDVLVAYGRTSGAPLTPEPVGSLPDVVQTFSLLTPTIPNAGLVSTFGVVSRPAESAGKAKAMSVATFPGSSDRAPLATSALLRLGRDRAEGVPLAVVAGAFTTKGAEDLVALAADKAPATGNRFWVLRARGAADFDPPLPGPTLPKDFALTATSNVALAAAGDLDGDGLAEIVTATPGARREATVLALTRPRLVEGGEVTHEAPVTVALDRTLGTDSALALADVDGDGSLDVVLLAGAGAARDLVVYWNDGHGVFHAEQSLVVDATGDAPRAFASIRVDAAAPRALAYATDRAVFVARFEGRAKVNRERIGDARAATAMAAGDFTGDGVEDLAWVGQGGLALLRGQAVLP